MDRRVLRLNLQLFAEDRTEKATPRRREEARKRGQVARSIEINSAVILLCTFFFLKIFSPWLGAQMITFSNHIMKGLERPDFASKNLESIILLTAVSFFEVCLPIMGIAFVAGLFSNFLQVGVLFTGHPLTPRLDRLNPVEGFKRIFSRRGAVELTKAVIKVGIVGYIAFNIVKSNLGVFPRLLDMSIEEAVKTVGELSSAIVLRIGVLLLFLAVLDYAYQYWEYEMSIRMTKQELKEEYRQYEGDPHIKAKIRQLQRQISLHRMMQELPKADVVITNPVHYAVALKYVPSKMKAPVVVAKGVDHMALRIKKIAEENNITIYEDPPLAQALYKSVEIGQAIPPELYEAVAHVLAFVYRLRNKHFWKMGVS
ncbi:MAG: flagellar biosynthesis protein FlhB [Thermacetogeniaceae bacterium]